MKNFIQYSILILCQFIFINATINGQDSQINWGPELEGKGLVDIVGEHGDYIYATQAGTKILNAYVNFLTIDKSTLQVVKTKKMDFSGLSTLPLDFSIVGDKLQALLVMKGKNFHRIIFDLDLNEISNELIVKFDKNPVSAESVEGMNLLVPTDLISSFRSEDKSKVAVMLTKSGKKRGGVEFFTFDINSDLKLLLNTNVRPMGKTPEKIADFEIFSDGTINMLVKRYIDGKKEHKKKKPNYKYAVYKIGLDAKQTEVLLPAQTTFWKNAKLKSFENGSIIVAGMTQLKPKDRPKGYQIIKCGENNDILYNESYPIKIGGEQKKLQKTFYLRDIVVTSDEDFTLLGEDAWIKSSTNAFGMANDDKYYSNTILLDAFGENGEKKWSECIYRKVEEKSRLKLLSDPLVFTDSNGMSLYYNTTKKNIDPYNSKKPKSEKLPSKKSVILAANISEDGVLTFEKLSEENKQHISTITSLETKDKIYFVGAKDNKLKKMYIGTVAK